MSAGEITLGTGLWQDDWWFRESEVGGVVSKKNSERATHNSPGRNESQDQGGGSDVTYFLIAGLDAQLGNE